MMTGTTEALAPANMLSKSAANYLHDLQQAARLAQTCRDQARLAVQQHELTGPVNRYDTTRGDDGAMNAPSDVIVNRQYDILTKALDGAEKNLEFAADWFAGAAVAACRAVLTGEQVTARQLEHQTLLRNGGWQKENHQLPPLPGLGDLDTGHEVLDQSVHKAQAPLEAAYRAAVTAETLAGLEDHRDDDGVIIGLTDWEASEMHDALDGARPLYDLLIAWASTVAHAAAYGRSRSYGHQPAE